MAQKLWDRQGWRDWKGSLCPSLVSLCCICKYMNAPAKTNLTQSILSAMHSRRFTIYYHQRPNSRHWFSCLPPDWRFFKDLAILEFIYTFHNKSSILACCDHLQLQFNCTYIPCSDSSSIEVHVQIITSLQTCQNTRIVYRCVSCFIHTDHLFILFIFFFNSLLSFTICDHLWLCCWLRWEEYIALPKSGKETCLACIHNRL